MKPTLVIADLPFDRAETRGANLTHMQMQRISGGMRTIVTVDGGPGTGTVNTFDIDNAIWEGRIKGPML